MATTFLLDVANTILSNEARMMNVEIEEQYQAMMGACRTALANPKDEDAQMQKVFHEDRLQFLNTQRDKKMAILVASAQSYLATQ